MTSSNGLKAQILSLQIYEIKNKTEEEHMSEISNELKMLNNVM